MSKNLSQIVADLFVNSKGAEELSSKVRRLRDEMKKVIESEDGIYGKFRGLLESFREIIPDEKQRYHAAIKGLSTTSKLSRQEIVKAVNDQLEELKILEKGLKPALPGQDEVKVMEAKAKEMKDEIARLRDQMARLQVDEDALRKSITAREKEMELAEKAIKDIFTDIGAEIATIKKKVEEFTAEPAPVQPVPQKEPVKSDVPAAKKAGGEQKVEIQRPPESQDTEFQKKCPMCGGRLNFLSIDKIWQCFTCAYEEAEKDEAPGKSGEKSEPAQTFDVPSADLSSGEYEEPAKASSPSKSRPSAKTKPCPSCRKKMFFFPDDNAWRCPSCQYETRF